MAQAFAEITGNSNVPQLFVKGIYIGGYEEIKKGLADNTLQLTILEAFVKTTIGIKENLEDPSGYIDDEASNQKRVHFAPTPDLREMIYYQRKPPITPPVTDKKYYRRKRPITPF